MTKNRIQFHLVDLEADEISEEIRLAAQAARKLTK